VPLSRKVQVQAFHGYDGRMPKTPLPPELDVFLSQPNSSVIATLQPDGSPHTAATWYLWENGRVLVNMDEGRRRLEYIRKDSRVSLTVLDKDDWYRHVTLGGQVSSIDQDPELEAIDRLSLHYTGRPYPRRDRARMSAWIDVESWHAWARGQPWLASR
jgi:PPOX class probable F420-dependent enzyme